MSILAMNTSINNNRQLLNKRGRFKNRLGGYASEHKTEYNLPNATTKQLKSIRKRVKVEQQNRKFLAIVITTVLFVGLVLLAVCFLEYLL